MKNLKRVLFFLLVFIPFLMHSQQLVYKPINPAFGGDTFNYNWLLSSAESQNKFEEKSNSINSQQSDLDRFTDMLNRQLLNSISQDLFAKEFGDSLLEVGTYVFGSLVIDISQTIEGLSISVLDTNSGDQTQIIIPNN